MEIVGIFYSKSLKWIIIDLTLTLICCTYLANPDTSRNWSLQTHLILAPRLPSGPAPSCKSNQNVTEFHEYEGVGWKVNYYRLFLMIDMSLYNPKVTPFRRCAKLCPVAFALNQRWPPTLWISMKMIKCCHNLFHQILLWHRFWFLEMSLVPQS